MEPTQMQPAVLDVSALLSGEERSKSFETDLIPGIDDQDVSLLAVRFSGEARERGGFISLEGRISCKFSAHCARCLAEVESELDFPVTLDAFEPDKLPEDQGPDQIEITDSKIDLEEVLFEQIVTHLPYRVLCREDCKGLCPKCGQDLNLSDCGCDKRQIDPRLEGLMDFFKDET